MPECSFEQNQPAEASLSKMPERGHLQSNIRAVPLSEQRQLLDGERRRVSESARDFLPDVELFSGDDLSAIKKDPKVMADSDKRKHEMAVASQNQRTSSNENSNQNLPAENANRNQPAENASNQNRWDSQVARQNNTCPATTADSNLRSSDLEGLFINNMGRLDTSRDGYVSESEIDAAVMDPSYSGRDAQLVAALHQHRAELEELSNDEIGDENDGVTLADMRQFGQQLSESQLASQMEAVGSGRFESIDSDRNGYLSESELHSAEVSAGTPEHQRSVIREMRARIDDIEGASDDEFGFENDGITRADLQAYNQDVASRTPTELFGAVDGTLFQSGESIRRGCDSLYATANPLDSIRPDAIHQGTIGDCYFLSAMASMANDPVGRQQLQNMIRDNGNGTYTVTFPGAPDEPITVTAPTDTETALYAQGHKLGTWPAVLERAYGRYCQLHPERRSPLNPDGGTNPAEGADGGSWTHDGIRMLTGRGVDVDPIGLTSEDELAANLHRAMTEHRPVTCSTGHSATDDLGLTDAQGLPEQHEYSVLAFDPSTRLVTIRNPWGHTEPRSASGGARDGIDDGVFVMTLAEYRRAFIQTAYAERA